MAKKKNDSETARVKVRIHSLHEDGETYAKGEEFDTTPDRAKALGDGVEILAPTPAEKTKA